MVQEAQNKNTEPENTEPKKTYQIYTMEEDLRKLFGEGSGTSPDETPSGKTPRDLTQKKSLHKAWLDASLVKQYLKPIIAALAVILVIIFAIFFLTQGGEKPEPEPLVYHAVCTEAQCKLTSGEGADECQIDEDCQLPPPQSRPIRSFR